MWWRIAATEEEEPGREERKRNVNKEKSSRINERKGQHCSAINNIKPQT